MANTTITIYKPNGDALMTIDNPKTWGITTDNKTLHVITGSAPEVVTDITTTLPFLIERTP
jgi:hypothetical protein